MRSRRKRIHKKNKLEVEKSILIAMNGLLLQLLNEDITFDDAEDLLFLPKNLKYMKAYNLNSEIIGLFEEYLVIDALFLFDTFSEAGLTLQKKIQKLLKNYQDVTIDKSISLTKLYTR